MVTPTNFWFGMLTKKLGSLESQALFALANFDGIGLAFQVVVVSAVSALAGTHLSGVLG